MSDAAPPTPCAGLPERYEILGMLGSGGMGRVLHARDRVLDRHVAVKVLNPYCALDESYTRRFLNEARAAARLNHPNIVQIYEFGTEESCAYLVMEYVDGPSLKQELNERGPYDEVRAAELIGQACLALGAAHEQGIMHRDVKPDNMMLTRQGAFKLVDLGLAKHEDAASDQTVTGATMGTPHYISPEQILGAKEIDRRADIYSLGATLFFLATGTTPYEGTSGAHIMAKHLNDPLPDPRRVRPELSVAFSRVVARAMAKSPDDRYQDTRDLRADLDRVRTLARPAPPPAPGATPFDATQPMAATPSGAPYCPTFDAPCCTPEVLQQLEDDLVAKIGPMGRILVGREIRTVRDRESLVRGLAEHIADREQRRAFLRRWSDAGSGSHASLSGSSATIATGPSPEYLDSLARCLADHIGPLAPILVRREAASERDPQRLLERLAGHVPDERARREFLGAARDLG